MKHNFKLPCMILATALAATLRAAVPLAWEARPNAPAPASFDRHHGEAIDFRCTLTGFDAAFAPAADVRLWYQTNGMGQAWWSAPATVQSNVITATWSPALDPGADRVSLFFGAPSNVYASAVLRLRHSPGFTPSSLPLPVPTLDFSAVELRNLAALTNGWSFGSTPGNYGVVSNAAMNAAPRFKDPALISCAWQSQGSSLKLLQRSIEDVEEWGAGEGSRQYDLAYDGAWLFRSYIVRLGSPAPDWQYTNTSSRAATVLVFGTRTFVRCDEVWDAGTNYPVAYMDDVSRVADDATNYTDAAVGRIDVPEWPVQLITTNAPLIFADGQDTNVASIALQAQPTNHTSLSFLHPVSYYLPNRFSLFELGNDYQIVGSQWFQVGRYLYAQNPENIVFVGGGRHRSLQDYLDACAPETLADLLSCYVPTNGGGRIHGDLEIDGRLTAGELITITNSDIHAKGFQVVDKVLTADGLTASNGMVRLNCARFVLGFGTPRVHVETNDLGSAVTYGGTWDQPSGNLSTFYSGKIEEVLAGNANEADIEKRNPYMTYGAVKRHFTGWEIKTHGVNSGPIKRYTLENYRTHYFGDENVGSGGIELNLQSNAHVRIVYDFAQTAPSAVYFEWGYEGGAEVRANGTQLSSPTAGACTLIEIEHLDGARYLVTEHEMSETYTTTSRYEEDEP